MKTRKKKDSGRINALEAGTLPPPAPAPKSKFHVALKNWKQAADALDYVRSIPSIFLDFNRATRIGGIPSRRIFTVHGPTHGGKSAFVAGLLRSYLDVGHVAAYVDAEHATDLGFLDQLLERPTSSILHFLGMRPNSYEETIDMVDEFLKWMVAERKARLGKSKLPLPPEEDLAAILFIDSLNKLVPEREIKTLREKGGDAIDKGWGMLRANYNQAFLDHVVPLLREAETCLGLIVQERDDDDLEHWEMPKLKGGKASQFDASMIVRVMKAAQVKRNKDDAEDKTVYGFRHRLRIWKSKVGHMDGRWSDAFFHMSNGNLVAPGFDLARDAVEVGKALGIIQESGSWLSWNKRRWNGTHAAVSKLAAEPSALAALQAACNAKLRAA